ncbi:MAG: DUF1934 domain-containing protein [Clostridia bacterium]|nr:DUF1934 domain-containing protein [Clostridia bacterium]
MLIMPISEYEKKAPAINGKRVIINMKSTQCDMTGVGLFSLGGDEDSPDGRFSSAPAKRDVNNEYKLMSEAVLEMKEGRLCISYEETAIEEVQGCTTVISFEPETPTCITVERLGPLSSAFVIERSKRIFSIYSTPFGSIDMCTYGNRVENTVTEQGGKIVLDYAVELRGMTAQRTRMELTVRLADGE